MPARHDSLSRGAAVVWFKRKKPAPIRRPKQSGEDDRPIVRQLGREPAGVNPYDTAPGSARRRRGAVRDGAHVPRSSDRNPYGTADGEGRRRSWDDAFIDTWVEHRRDR
jgi:hypothetical protein